MSAPSGQRPPGPRASTAVTMVNKLGIAPTFAEAVIVREDRQGIIKSTVIINIIQTCRVLWQLVIRGPRSAWGAGKASCGEGPGQETWSRCSLGMGGGARHAPWAMVG